MEIFLNTADKDYDFVCFSELFWRINLIWLHCIFSNFCKQTTKHSGIVIFTKNGLHLKVLNLKRHSSKRNSEFFCVGIYDDIIILTVYRFATGNFEIFLELAKHFFTQKSQKVRNYSSLSEIALKRYPLKILFYNSVLLHNKPNPLNNHWKLCCRQPSNTCRRIIHSRIRFVNRQVKLDVFKFFFSKIKMLF